MDKQSQGIARRDLVCAGGALVAGSLVAAGAARADAAETTVAVNYANTVAWDTEYDVVVVGWGGAGSVAAITAAENGARVLLTEKAPEGHEGGNTRYCEQFFCIPTTYEDGVDFFNAMAAGFDTSTDEIVDFMARGSVEIEDWLLAHGAERFGYSEEYYEEITPESVAQSEYADWIHFNDDGTYTECEYVYWPDGTLGANRVRMDYRVNFPDDNEKKYWNLMRSNVVGLKDSIDVWFESPAVQLIQDPFTKTILGVKINKKGQDINVRALNGVVLACGSYEANPEMYENYAQIPQAYPLGTVYNTGDGILMGIEVGADLWHMDALSGPWICTKMPGTERVFHLNYFLQRITEAGNCIYVGGDSKRFMNESGACRHGHVNIGGTWMSQPLPDVMWAVMDSTARNGGGSIDFVPEEELVEASTIAELADVIGLDADTLVATVERWNEDVAAGADPRFERLPVTLAPIETAPFYAVRLWPGCVNAQGGPKRNVRCEVLDTRGEVIPHLYSAGELGSFWAGVYMCGGNIAETVYTGREAGANAAKTKDPVPETVLAAVESAPASLGSDIQQGE